MVQKVVGSIPIARPKRKHHEETLRRVSFCYIGLMTLLAQSTNYDAIQYSVWSVKIKNQSESWQVCLTIGENLIKNALNRAYGIRKPPLLRSAGTAGAMALTSMRSFIRTSGGKHAIRVISLASDSRCVPENSCTFTNNPPRIRSPAAMCQSFLLLGIQ